jgi:hypothetical protein
MSDREYIARVVSEYINATPMIVEDDLVDALISAGIVRAELAIPDTTDGQWTVDVNEGGAGVYIGFFELGLGGVSSFATAMPRDNALLLAAAILNKALEVQSERGDR